MRFAFILIIIILFSIDSNAKKVKELFLDTANLKSKVWNGFWITHPDISIDDYNVVLFRKTIDLPIQPLKYIINISASNRYYLYINGEKVCYGPQLSDPRHWRYETIDIAPFLKSGKNIIAVEVVNWGEDRFFGIMSPKTGLMINGQSENEKAINTENSTWKTYTNKAYRPNHPNWMWSVDIVGGFYASNPGDSITASKYPWGWQQQSFDDMEWKTAKYLSGASSYDGAVVWMLAPRTTPLQVDSLERFTKIVKSEGIAENLEFLKGKKALQIPANSNAKILIDQTYLTIGYPELKVSGGKNTRIKITYAENLFNKDKSRGNRNDLENKIVIGLNDVYILDGGKQRIYKPTWNRSFRFIQLDIKTQEEPLIIEDYYNVYSSAPIVKRAEFKSDNPIYDKIMDICWRSARIGTQDNLVSDAYYEQMQYVGDSRVHALTNLYLSGEDIWLRNAIEQFDYSRSHDGMLTSCYPLKAIFIIPTYTLLWIDMVHDFMMLRDDKAFVKKYLPNIQHSLSWFENNLNANGLLGKSKYDNFVDWYPITKTEDGGGEADVTRGGNSAVVNLHYVYSLQNAADIFEYCGKPYEANMYRQLAARIQKAVFDYCYDSKTETFFEDAAKTYACQRPNIMAVITNTIPADQQRKLLEKIIPDTALSQAGLYYRFNMFNAMAKASAGHLFDEALKPWVTLLNFGLTTTTEVPLDPRLSQRSDSHPWSTSPAMAFFSLVCGIQPAEIGFKSVKISPQMGNLKFIEAKFPHYKGDIILNLKRTSKDGIEGTVQLPADLTGKFIWMGKEMTLQPGKQKIKL